MGKDRDSLRLSQSSQNLRSHRASSRAAWGVVLASTLITLVPTQSRAQGEVLPCRGATEYTYFPRGDHWAVIPGQTIFYRQQQDGSKDIAGPADLAAVNRAAATWMTHQCADGFPNIFVFDGYEENGNMDYPTRDNGDVYDGSGNILSWENIFYWEQNPNEWYADVDLTAALTTNIFLPQTDGMVTADIQFNDLLQFSNGVNIATPFRWRTVSGATPVGCPDGNAKCFDVETVALHELGHFIGLNHVNCSDSVMFPEGSSAQEVVVLSRHEERAICAMYPPVPMDLMTERYWMEQCSSNTQCPEGLCVFPAGLEGTVWGYCTQSCSTTSECPEATICATTTGLPGFCKPGPNFTGGPVTGGCGCDVDSSCSANCGCDPDCAVCTTSAQCTGGLICQNGQCTTCSNNGQCTGGQACIGGTCQNCTTNSQCAGLVCSGGSCVSCTQSSDCDTGLVCTSGFCTGCSTPADCTAGQICSGGLCSPCSNNSQCTGGDVCVAGSCQVCTDSNQCTGGAVCSGGSCVGCSVNTDCQNGQICSGSNVCTDCTSNAQCDGGLQCNSGRCGACTGGCTGGQVCVAGSCQNCTTSAQCGNGQICSSGTCSGCNSNAQCSGGQVCIVASCVPCSNDAQCGGGMICQGGSCSACTESSQCPNGRVCSGGACVPCTGYADCYGGLLCNAGSCTNCSSDSQCPNGLVCSGGRCIGCTSASQCGGGQVCIGGECADCTVDAQCPGTQVCGPTGQCQSGGGVGTVDPETGLPLDLCTACTASNQCSTAVCASDGVDSICSIECYSGSLPQGTPTANGCPEGFDCLAAGNGSVCWPQDIDSCGDEDERADVNEVCYQANLPGTSDDVFVPCGPSLVCLDFKPRCAGQEGACVSFCNPDQPCPNTNETCCYGIDDNGSCLGFDADLGRVFGGCYEIRQEGETCVSAEQSICELGLGCFNFGDASSSRCFRTCSTQICGAGTSCFGFTDACTNSFDLCCDNGNASSCEAPSPVTNLAPLGAPCTSGAQCDTSVCTSFDGQSACSRICNAVTGIGCPNAEFDADGDGLPDGGYQCRATGNGDEGHCWPNALVMPDPEPDPDPDPVNRGQAPSGCSQSPTSLLGLLLLLGLVRRRRG